jgi:O-glycosyl hydrolase
MTNRKLIAALISVAIASVFLGAGCELVVNDPIRNVPIFEPYISFQPESYSIKVSDFNPAAVPTLSVTVSEWDRLDGTLSYQWYTFDKLEEFYKKDIKDSEGELVSPIPPIAGATGSSYQPGLTVTQAVAGKTYYYYVEVTNTNPDAIGGRTSASITSDVAAISFYGNTDPETPRITQSPANSTYTMGRQAAIASLEVRATVDTGSISYQWYKFNINDGFTDGVPNGTLIPTAILRTYLPAMSDLGVGDNFYYVVVSNVAFNAGGTETGRSEKISVPANITMGLGQKAAPPRIIQQPKDILYFTGEDISLSTAAKLSVGAASVDGGTPSYQWYKSATAAGTGATEVSGATGEDYKPANITAAAGFYYVVVTNTNEFVVDQSNKTATEKSKIVEIKVQAPGTAGTIATTITPNPATKYQYIRGYGGMETTWGNFFQSNETEMHMMFGKGPDQLGYNIWRIMIPPVTTNIDDPDNGLEQYVTTRSYTNRYYENVKIVNSYGGYVLASPWSPPKEWKSNNSINSGGHLLPAYYKQYASYLRSYARHMLNHGAPIYAVSIANEPNYAGGYDGCEWKPEEMRDFFKQVGRFTQGVRGFGGGKVTPTVLTVNGESANNPDINHSAMNDPAANAAIDMFARHVYGDQLERLWGHPKLNGRDVWMTEHNINSASAPAFPNDWTYNYIWRFMNDVDLVIRRNNENAFVWWVVKRFYSFLADGDAGTPTPVNTPGSSTGTILPRGWGLAHYSKFTIDTTRIGVGVTTSGSVNSEPAKFNMDDQSVKVTAFISQDGNELSLVMWTPTDTSGGGGYALGRTEIKMPSGFKIRSASAMRSKAPDGGGGQGTTENMGKWESVEIASNRESAYVDLPRAQILSVKFIKE